MRRKILSAIFTAAFAVASLAKDGSAPPVMIDPSVKAVEDAYTVKAGRKYWVGEFSSGVGEGAAVGYTRISRKVNSPIVCDPTPGAAVRATLIAALAAQGALAESAEKADFVITANVPSLTIEETTKTLHQTISASLRVEVVVTSVSDPSRTRKLNLQSGGERTAFDASKHAEGAAREAVKSAVGEILKNIDSL